MCVVAKLSFASVVSSRKTAAAAAGANASACPAATTDAGGIITPDSPQGKKYFRKRTLFIVLLAVGFVAINWLSGVVVDFDFVKAIQDFPAAIVWMATNFVPSTSALDKMPQILSALASTVLSAVASSVSAALFAYIMAVLGSRSVGLGGPVPIIVRGIASLFRNIPVVAWAFILLFSFNQSEFTGFLALFFGKCRRN